MRWSLPDSSIATQKAARRPPTGAIPALRPGQRGWTECESKPTSIFACPFQSPSKDPACPPPSTPVSPRLCPGAVWEGSYEPSQATQTWIWEEVGRGRSFPSNLRQAWLRESFSEFPAAPAQVASAGRADGGECASLAAASAATAASSALWAARSREAGRAPRGQALLLG